MDLTTLIGTLATIVPAADFEPGAASDVPTFYLARDHLLATCRALRDHPDLRFDFLADVTAVDWWPREPRFEVVYHMVALEAPRRIRVKVRLSGDDPRIPTLTPLWPAADWLEREVWDLFGIGFDGHPDLRRLLMPDDWEGHPLRKDYPVQIHLPVRTHEPLQVSEEEFRANLVADRASRTGR